MPNNELLKAVMGQGGALVLACIVLYQVMSQYETLIDTMIQDNKEDRAMYQQNMSELSNHMDKVNDTLEKIQEKLRKAKTKRHANQNTPAYTVWYVQYMQYILLILYLN